MNQTGDITANLLRDPPEEMQRLMADPRMTNEAREAVASVMKTPSSNGTGGANGINHRGDGRLQVVNERQEFTYVLPGVLELNGNQEGVIALPSEMGNVRQRIRLRRSIRLRLPIHR